MKLERKGYILLLVVLFSLIFITSYPAPNIILTPDNVNIDTFIKNSNGGVWSVTNSNLQTSIWDLNNASGTVWLGSDITISGTIELGEHTVLDLDGHNITISGNQNGIEMAPGSTLRNGNIETSTYTGNMIYLNGTRFFIHGTVGKRITTIENIDLCNTDLNGTGIFFDCTSNNSRIAGVYVYNVNTFRFRYGINMSAYYDPNTASFCFCNGNFISMYRDTQSRYQIYLYRNESALITQGAISGNSFTNIQLQRAESPDTIRSIYNSGNGNYFQGVIWDSAGGNRAVELASCSQETTLILPGLTVNDIYNNGTNARIVSDTFTTMFPYYDQPVEPTVNDNCTAYWYDSGGGWLYQICNTYGTTYYVNMTTVI